MVECRVSIRTDATATGWMLLGEDEAEFLGVARTNEALAKQHFAGLRAMVAVGMMTDEEAANQHKATWAGL